MSTIKFRVQADDTGKFSSCEDKIQLAVDHANQALKALGRRPVLSEQRQIEREALKAASLGMYRPLEIVLRFYPVQD